jgi:hypothetical protein
MNKRIAIPIISVLTVVAIVLCVFYFQETSRLNDTQDEIVGLEENISALETKLLELHAETAALTLAVFLPDANLRTAIRKALNNPQGTIHTYQLEAIAVLEAPQMGISDVTGLEYCISLHLINLEGNNISDLAPLVANRGLAQGDFIYLRDNPLNNASVELYIPQLKQRGVFVEY